MKAKLAAEGLFDLDRKRPIPRFPRRVAIITAILLFGGLWGFWGVFFAIPLATVIQAVINAWPAQPLSDDTAAAA